MSPPGTEPSLSQPLARLGRVHSAVRAKVSSKGVKLYFPDHIQGTPQPMHTPVGSAVAVVVALVAQMSLFSVVSSGMC